MRMPTVPSLRALVALAGLAALPSAALAQWNPPMPIVTTAQDEETGPGSFALDGNDRFHLVWVERTPGTTTSRILFRRGRPGNWDPDVEIAPPGEHYEPHLAVHLNGSSHVVWITGSTNAADIRYATDASGSWVTESLTSNATGDFGPAIAVDGDDRPHVVWAGWDPSRQKGKIFYARRDPSGWTTKILAASYIGDYWMGAQPSIAVTGDGVPQIAYRASNYQSYRVDHATNVTGPWTYQALPTPNLEDFSSSIRCDPYGILHLAIGGHEGWGMPAHVHFATSLDRGVTWSTRTLVSGSHSAAAPVLAVDPYGLDRVAWEETSGNFYTGTIFQATNQTGSWTNAPVTGPAENYKPSLAVDGSGFSHVFYTFQLQTPPFPNDLYYVSNAQPTVTVTMSPAASTTIPRGGTLPIDVTVSNETPMPQTIEFWMTGINARNGNERFVPSSRLGFPNPLRGTIPAGATVTRRIELSIPASAPTALFTLTASVGNAAAVTYLDRASLWARIVP
jgi:hypothetical protein